jgi:CHASE2 domain-containing sensor protein
MVIIASACVAVVLTAIINHLPKFDLVEAALNDDNFTDMVLKTRGDLPIDSAIRVVTYDRAIFDSSDRVDREALALRLAALLELKPRVVGADFLLEDERPGKPEGDAMLAALIADHPNLIFGIFHEDSLGRFRVPPASFGLRRSQLGCINLMEDKDRTIRTYSPLWGAGEKEQFESLDLLVARATDSAAAAYLASFDGDDFTIDYAAGIGETRRAPDAGGDQIFPVMPIDTIFSIVSSGDSVATEALRREFAGKAVLVGYGDIRNSQVTSVVDRFYTPFKPDENSLPDMHGVAIHANIVNTILRHRVVRVIPLWIDLIWGALVVMAWLFHRERMNRRVRRPALRAVITYGGFGLLFFLGVLLPVLAYRYTPYKFSIYTPVAGLLLAVPTLEVLDKGIGIIRDLTRRRRLERPIPPSMRAGLLATLKSWDPEERLQRAIHLLQLQFHAACAILFREAPERFDRATIASPTLPRMIAALDAAPAAPAASPRGAHAEALLRAIAADATLSTTLRFSRSLYIALNEIRRQSEELDAGENHDDAMQETMGGIDDYADLALKTLSGGPGEAKEERFDELYPALERLARRMREIMGNRDELIAGDEEHGLAPFLLRSRCRLHGVEERFIYFGEQEDANNRDDYYDLVYGGPTIRCQPEDHPGLSRFRELIGEPRDAEG